MECEIYSVDYDKDKGIMVYGGNNHKCTVFRTLEDNVEGEFEGFTDSVMFCKSLSDRSYVICTIDGTISIMTLEEEKYEYKLDEDISFADVVADKIIIGACSGTIYIFTMDLQRQDVFIGHSSEIIDVKFFDNKVFSLSKEWFIVFDSFSYQQKYSYHVKNATAFENIPHTEIFCIGREYELLLLKTSFLLQKIPVKGIPEVIRHNGEYFIVGGDFNYLFLINTKMNMQSFTIYLNIDGISNISLINKYSVAISTFCGLVGVGDVRKQDSFVLFESKVETVFDFKYFNNIFYIGGLKGIDIIDTTSFE